MKTPAKKPNAIKARVMWAHPTTTPDDGWPHLSAFSHSDGTSYPALLVRCPTIKQARALKRFFDLSEEEKVEAIAKALPRLYAFRGKSGYRSGLNVGNARAVRSMMYGGPHV